MEKLKGRMSYKLPGNKHWTRACVQKLPSLKTAELLEQRFVNPSGYEYDKRIELIFKTKTGVLLSYEI